MATLSLCMIVRDVEGPLRSALESARPYVDEMVVVDTGSSDATPDVASTLGARVAHFPWCDDFSAARNRSLELASGDWVLWMDADDVLAPGSGEEVRRVVRAHPDRDRGFLVQVEEPYRKDGRVHVQRGAQPRLFPRREEIRFCYRVHEQVAPSIRRAGLRLEEAAITIRHAHVDRSAEANRRRNERNLRLLRLDLADHPDDGFVLMNVGLTRVDRGEPEEAVRSLRDAIPRLPRASTRLNAYLQLDRAYARTGDATARLQAAREGLRDFPDALPLLLRVGRASEAVGSPSEAADAYERAIARGRVDRGVVHSEGLRREAMLRLGWLLRRHGDAGRTEALWRQWLSRGEDAEVREALVRLLIVERRADEAERELGGLPEGPVRTALDGCLAVLREQWERAHAALLESYRQGHRDPMQLHGLSVALLMQGELSAAEPILTELLRLEPDHPHARPNLASVYRRTGRTRAAERLLEGEGPEEKLHRKAT